MQTNKYLFLIYLISILIIKFNAETLHQTKRNLQDSTKPSSVYCVEGCLKCNLITGFCDICDFSTGFIATVDSKGCQKSADEFCEVLDIEGDCDICKSGYYYNAVAKACQEVVEDEVVENCDYYDKTSTCVQCKSGFYLGTDSLCQEFKNGIEGCIRPKESNPSLCEKCVRGKLLSTTGTACLDKPEGTCSSFKNAQCLECKSGYILNLNNYLITTSQFATSISGKEMLNNILKNVISNDLNSIDHKVCSEPIVSNCAELKTYDKCGVCLEDHYMSQTFDCIPNPEDQIQFCVEYDNQERCILCKDNYFFYENDPSVCVEGAVVENCMTYEINKDSCGECTADYYLDVPNNQCLPRVASKGMVTCKVFNKTKDECLICKDTFALTLDGCQPGVENCAEYEDSQVSVDQLTCTKCNPGFYFDGDQGYCVQPSTFVDDFCIEYKFTQPICDVCKDKYFFDAQLEKCKLHDNPDENCLTTSKTARNSCSACKQGYKAYSTNKICKNVAAPIENCLEYETETNCKKCKYGYYGTNCTEISPSLYCLKVFPSDINKCEICATNYFTNATPHANVCVTVPDTQFNSCETLNLANGEELPRCYQCEVGHFPLNLGDLNYSICELKSKHNSLPDFCDMVHYNPNGDIYTCKLCSSGYYDDNGTCLEGCSAGKVKKLLTPKILDADNHLTFEEGASCHDSDTDFPNCELIVPRVDIDYVTDGFSYVCGKCKSGYSTVVDYHNASARIKTHNYDVNVDSFSYGLRSIEKTCATIQEPAGLLGTTSKAGCEIFVKLNSTPQYGCIKCESGKTGKIVKAGSTNFYVIETCEQSITGCLASETNLAGITAPDLLTENTIWNPYEMYVSCAVCQGTETTIPFLSFKMNSSKIVLINYLGEGDIINDGDITVAQTPETPPPGEEAEPVKELNGTSVSCRDYTKNEDFNLPEDSTIIFPENCALGAFEVDQSTVENAIYCLACKKGFVPTKTGRKVASCSPISRCQGSTTFNSCSKCEVPFDEGINSCTVADIADTNCLRSLNGVCKVCKELYTLNQDGVCEKINIFQCEEGKMELPGAFKTKDLEFLISQQDRIGVSSLNFGCSKCAANYISISNIKISNVCISSSYLVLDSLPSNTQFIKNCLKYGSDPSDESFLCRVCKSGLIPNGSFTECVNQLPGCLQTQVGNDNLCQTCDLGRTNVSGVCKENNIANCENYTTNGVSLSCSKCLDGYYIQDGTECIQGKVSNCSIYENNSAENCLECASRFVKYTNVQGKTFCLSYENFHCKQWNNASSFACDLCDEGYFITSPYDTDPSDYCIGGNYTISNCSFIDTDLLCVGCSSQYYLNGSRTECLPRKKTIQNCEVYSPNSDECQKCIQKHYIHSNGQCYPYPTGIQFCKEYSDAATCTKCDPNKYLDNNLCHNIVTFVDNCLYYSADGKCSQCMEDKFFVSDTSCVSINASNCLEVKSPDECLSCPKGYGFSMSGGVKSCIQVNLANCSENTVDEPYICTKCDNGFYLFNNQCQLASPAIDGCLEYKSNSQCSKCKEYFVLSKDLTKCLSNYVVSPQIDFNCKTYVEKEFACATCPANMQFALPTTTETTDTNTDTTTARLLSSFNNNFINRILQSEENEILNYQCTDCGGEGCFLCDPKDSSICIFCKPTYYMDMEGGCVLAKPIVNETSDSNIKLFSSMVVTMLFVLFIKF